MNTTNTQDPARDALESLSNIADWLEENAPMQQNHPEEPPDFATEFDARLNQAAHGIREAIAALQPAAAQPQGDAREVIDNLRRALEVIAVGDSKNPVQDAGDELVALGFWSAEAWQAATAQASEPSVALEWRWSSGGGVVLYHPDGSGRSVDLTTTPVYLAAPARAVEPLTEEEAAQELLDAAYAFWNESRKSGRYGAVKWVEYSGGEVVIFTRGEYRDAIMAVIDGPKQPVHFFRKGEADGIGIPATTPTQAAQGGSNE